MYIVGYQTVIIRALNHLRALHCHSVRLMSERVLLPREFRDDITKRFKS